MNLKSIEIAVGFLSIVYVSVLMFARSMIPVIFTDYIELHDKSKYEYIVTSELIISALFLVAIPIYCFYFAPRWQVIALSAFCLIISIPVTIHLFVEISTHRPYVGAGAFSPLDAGWFVLSAACAVLSLAGLLNRRDKNNK